MTRNEILISLLVLLTLSGLSIGPANAQWWNPFGYKDYEDCAAAAANQNVSKPALGVLLRDCATKFEGRRSKGGGYHLYSWEYEESCEIVGPNPTSSERERCNREMPAKASAKAEHWKSVKSRIQTSDPSLKCSSEWCIYMKGTAKVSNYSDERIVAFYVGWVILPPSVSKCPKAYPKNIYVNTALGPNEDTVVDFIADSPSEKNFRYCVGVAEIVSEDFKSH